MIKKSLIDTKEKEKENLMNLDNVRTVGIGAKRKSGKKTDEESIIIGVSEKKNEEDIPDDQIVPKRIGDHSTDVIEVGEIEPLKVKENTEDKSFLQKLKDKINIFSISHKDKKRPVPIGSSIGHEDVTAGTSSFILQDDNCNEYPASNNHVLANCNKGKHGDSVIQPGSYDGGIISDDKVGELEDYIKVEDGMKVDLAWLNPNVEFKNKVLELSEKVIAQPYTDLSWGDKVIKSGRTTKVTEGEVQQMGVSVNVKYGEELGTIRLEDQILTGDMSDGGDSGSAVFYEQDGFLYPVALLFAGSDSVTVMNKIDNVISESGMSIKTESDEELKKNNDNNNSLLQWILELLRRFFN